jgi:hypothetical protein
MPRNVGRKTQGQDRASTEAALLKRVVITIPAKDWDRDGVYFLALWFLGRWKSRRLS